MSSQTQQSINIYFYAHFNDRSTFCLNRYIYSWSTIYTNPLLQRQIFIITCYQISALQQHLIFGSNFQPISWRSSTLQFFRKLNDLFLMFRKNCNIRNFLYFLTNFQRHYDFARSSNFYHKFWPIFKVAATLQNVEKFD